MLKTLECQKMSDEEIVKQVLLDHSFFHCIVAHYERRLRQFVYRQSGLPNAEIDEILQEAYIRVFKNLRDFDFDLKFQSWIYRIVRNLTIDHLRHNNKHLQNIPLISSDDDERNLIEVISDDSDLGSIVESQLDVQKLGEIVSSLPTVYRDVAILRFWEDKDYSEISDIIRKPIGTVGSLVSRAKKMILDQYKKGEL